MESSVVGRLQELLKAFKDTENPSSTKFIEKDEVAISLLSAWSNLPVTLQDPLVFGGPPQHKPNLWKYLWKFRKVEYRELEKRTGIEDRRFLSEKLNVLINHQLIYPDGSISKPAERLLASR